MCLLFLMNKYFIIYFQYHIYNPHKQKVSGPKSLRTALPADTQCPVNITADRYGYLVPWHIQCKFCFK